MSFRVVHDYYRQELFDFFRPYPWPFWAVTFDLEITRLRRYLAERQYPTYLNLGYLLVRAIQEVEDFRYRLRDDRIVLYDTLHPGLTVPAPGRRFSFAHFDYHPKIAEFNRRAVERRRQADGERLNLSTPDRAWVFFSALPGVPFTALTHAVTGPDDDQPRVSFGRFREAGGATTVPVGLQVNHRFIDGAAVSDLVERTQQMYDDPESDLSDRRRQS